MSRDELVYFCPGVGLVSSDTNLGEEISPKRQVAQELLRAGKSAPRLKDFAGAIRNPEMRLIEAASLLAEAVRRERASDFDGAQALWPIVDAAWTRLANDAGVFGVVAERARGLTIAEPEAVASEVLGAAKTELVPGIHAALASAEVPIPHREFHKHAFGQAAGLAKPLPGAIARARWWLRLEEARARAERSPLEALDLYASVLAEIPEGLDRCRVGREAGGAADAALKSSEKADWAYTTRIKKMEALARLLPYDFTIRQIMSTAYILRGVALANDAKFDSGARDLAVAAALDPLDSSPAKLIEQAREVLEKHRANLLEVTRRGGVLNETGRNLAREASRNMKSWEEFGNSKEAGDLRLEVEQAAVGQIACALGLDPYRSNDLEEAHRFASAAWECSPNDEATTDAFLRREAGKFGVVDSGVWVRLKELLREIPNPPAAILALALPGPAPLEAPPDDAVFFRTVGAALTSRSPGKARSPRLDRWVIYPWVFSRSDVVAKSAAVAGIALLLWSGGSLASRRWDAWARDRAYERFRAVQASARPAEAIDAARSFIEHSGPGLRDSRLPEVRDGYARAIFAGMAAASEKKDQKEMARLGRHARTLDRWYMRAGAVESGEEGR